MSRLGELLLRENLISPDQLRKAQEEQRRTGGRLAANLTKMGYIEERTLTDFISNQYGVPSIDLRQIAIDPDVLKFIPHAIAKKHHCVPVQRAGSTLVVAMSDPANIYAIDDLKFLTGYNIEVVVAAEALIDETITRYYEKQTSYEEVFSAFDDSEIDFEAGEEEANASQLAKDSEDAPVVRLCNLILVNAIKKKASDIHIEPYEKDFRVRYRIDGVLYEEMRPPMKLRNAITSRIKIMSSLDIAERRLPQDGRIKLKLGKGQEMDYRVSVLPTLFGEKIVMRLLDKSNLQLDMTKLGFEEEQLTHFKKAIHMPWGMTLVTGPTGSGKTTSLYSALAELNQTTENISTAEDPVEFNLLGINQVQMHDDIGLNFATALRSFLRQDPDIIMVGEIRDFETAEIAVKAALTGHMVLSTLHTNDAPATVQRLLNMGIEPFLVTASVNLILAQRLARKICNECKEEAPKNVQALLDAGMKPDLAETVTVYKGAGCKVCNNTGYKGRIALYEVMPFMDPLKELVIQGATAAEIKAEAIRCGMKTLRASGLSKVAEGMTTVAEVSRVTIGD
jgi:type IV pilus assembly protein PilB